MDIERKSKLKKEENDKTPDTVHTHGTLKKNNRIVYLDIARTIAIILVVFCHAIEAVYKMNMQEWNTLSLESQIFRTVSFTIARLGVPIFLFISGKLLLEKKFENEEDFISFYKKNLLPLLLCTEIWIILYNIVVPIINKSSFNIKELLLNILFLKQVNLPNMWYMPMIIGVYIAIPFLAIIVKKVSIKTLKVPMIIVFLTNFLIPNIGKITKVLFNESYNTILDVSFLGGTYGLYILLGYYIGKGKFKNVKTRYLIIGGVASFILTCIYQMWLYNNNMAYNVWYSFSGLLVTSACVFEILSRVNIKLNKYIESAFTYISKISLAIFFLHIVVQKTICKIVSVNVINKPISILVLTVLVFGISLLIITILSKAKILKEKLLLVK